MRNYSISSKAGGSDLGGTKHPIRLLHAPNITRRNPSIPPLPAQSLLDAPIILDSDREIGATVFVIGFYAFIIVSLYAIIKICS